MTEDESALLRFARLFVLSNSVAAGMPTGPMNADTIDRLAMEAVTDAMGYLIALDGPDAEPLAAALGWPNAWSLGEFLSVGVPAHEARP